MSMAMVKSSSGEFKEPCPKRISKDYKSEAFSCESVVKEIQELVKVAKLTQAWKLVLETIESLESAIGSSGSDESKAIELKAELDRFKANGEVLELGKKNEKIQRCLDLMKEEDRKSWRLVYDGSTKIYQKKEAGEATFTFLLTSTLNVSLFNLTACIMETDMLGNWIPMMTASKPIATVSTYDKIVELIFYAPFPMSTRELMIEGFGVDFEERGSILVILSSLDSHELVELPALDPAYVRWKMVIGGFWLEYIDEEVSGIKLIMNVDPMMPLVPDWIMNFVVSNSLSWIFGNLEKCAKFGPDSEYAKRIKANPAAYDTVARVVERTKKRKLESSEM